jgi:mediator of RNA polymerase II transcription subunit 7
MDPDNGPSLTSAFPPPPPFYKFFTSENLQLLRAGHVPDSAEQQRQLQYLVPPPAPTEGAYTTFGDVWPVQPCLPDPCLCSTDNQLPERLPSLEEMGVKQLYSAEPDLDRTAELRSLTKSALMNYLELVGIMAVDPAGWTEKIDDLRIIFINMHHLLNEYRPHQVRPMLQN